MLPPKINNKIILIIIGLLCVIIASLFINTPVLEGATDYETKFDEDADELAAKNKPADNQPPEEKQKPDPSLSNMNNPDNLPLREFFLMASYDSTYDGKSCSIETLADVMYSGCRFIDLNLFMGTNEKRLFVGPTKDINATTADLKLKLADVLAYIDQYAFTVDNKAKARAEIPLNERTIPGINKPAENAPSMDKNYTEYPLFLNFRIQQTSPETDILTVLYNDYLAGEKGLLSLKHRMVSGETATQVNSSTPLRELRRKIVICIDIDNVLKNYTPNTMNALDVKQPVKDVIRKFVNVKTGGHTWHTYHSFNTVESMPTVSISPKGGDLSTDVQKMYLVYPGVKDADKNPNALMYLFDHGIQTSLMRFYLKDGHLDEYKKTFRERKSPMVPINTVIRKVAVLK